MKRLRKSWFDSCCGHPIKFTDDRDIHSVKKRVQCSHNKCTSSVSNHLGESLTTTGSRHVRDVIAIWSDSEDQRSAFRRLFVQFEWQNFNHFTFMFHVYVTRISVTHTARKSLENPLEYELNYDTNARTQVLVCHCVDILTCRHSIRLPNPLETVLSLLRILWFLLRRAVCVVRCLIISLNNTTVHLSITNIVRRTHQHR